MKTLSKQFNKPIKQWLIASMSVLLMIGVAAGANAATYSVNSTADTDNGSCNNVPDLAPDPPDTDCTLREAINAANASVGVHDVIDMSAIKGAAPATINLVSGLPSITDSVTMDGSIAEGRVLPGNPTVRPGITLDASGAIPTLKNTPFFGPLPYWPNALTLKGPGASGSEIRGMHILASGLNAAGCEYASFNPDPNDPLIPEFELCGAGIFIFGVDNATIAGNYIGVDAEGSALASPYNITTSGIVLNDGNYNMIGGNTANDRNILSGSRESLLGFSRASMLLRFNGWANPAFGSPKTFSHNKVVGNYANVDAFGNNMTGVNNYIALVMFSGNTPNDSTDIGGGLVIPGAFGYGPQCPNSDECKMIGNVFDSNTLYSNTGSINLEFGGYHENTVINNNIFKSNPLVGSFGFIAVAPSTQNVDVRVEPGLPVDTIITNNLLGVDENGDPDGLAFLPLTLYSNDGALVKGNTIRGGIVGVGIAIQDLTAFDNRFPDAQNVTITQNSIYDNDLIQFGRPPIDLYEETNIGGVTANDLLDSDTGVNNLQNYPVLTQISFDPAVAFLTGTLNSKPNSLYVIEFFSNDAMSVSGHGEGKSYLTSRTVATDANGDASFAVPYNDILGEFLTDADGKTYITATATAKFCEEDGSNCKPGSTSEFSKACEADLSDLEIHDQVLCDPGL